MHLLEDDVVLEMRHDGRIIRHEQVNANDPSPYDWRRLYGDEKYGLQNMLLARWNAPNRLRGGYGAHRVWSDQIHAQWEESLRGIESSESNDAWWNGVSNQNLRLFARRIAWRMCMSEKVVGMRIVRYTDAHQYPMFALDIIFRA